MQLTFDSTRQVETSLKRAGTSIGYPLAITAVAVAAWATSLSATQVGDLTQWGLAGAVSPLLILAPLAAIGAFAISLRQRDRSGILTAHMTGIITMLYGSGAVVGNSIHARIVLRHQGITDQVQVSGAIDPTIDAYFNWPGFFAFFAYVREVSGVESFAGVGIWVPVLVNVALIAPLLVIFRFATSDRNVVWTSVLIFFLGNWIGQDYFAPQAAAYYVHLVIVAILLHFFGRATPLGANRVTYAKHLAVAMALFLAIVPSHQLTPPLTIVSAIGLVLTWQCTVRRIPIFFGAVFVSWLVFMSSTYLGGNLAKMLELVGDIGAATTANVTERVGGSEAHQLVVLLRLGFTICFWLAASAGLALKRRRWESSDRAMVSLASMPLLLVALQPYGGEMVLRVFMFTLPFVAFYIAQLVTWRARDRRVAFVKATLVAVSTLVVASLFLLTRYGNAAIDQFSSDELRGLEVVYEDAEPGSLLLVAVDNVSWKFRGYDSFDHRSIDRLVRTEIDPLAYSNAAVALMYQRRDTTGAYFIATESQQSYIDLLGGLPPDALRSIENQLSGDPNIEVILNKPTIRIYKLSALEGGS